jgi:hypothetical protein
MSLAVTYMTSLLCVQPAETVKISEGGGVFSPEKVRPPLRNHSAFPPAWWCIAWVRGAAAKSVTAPLHWFAADEVVLLSEATTGRIVPADAVGATTTAFAPFLRPGSPYASSAARVYQQRRSLHGLPRPPLLVHRGRWCHMVL